MQLIMSTDMDIGIKSTSSIDQESFKNKETTTNLVHELMNELTNGNKENIEKQEQMTEELNETENKTKCITSEVINKKDGSLDTNEDVYEQTPNNKNSCEVMIDTNNVVNKSDPKLIYETNFENVSHSEDIHVTEIISKICKEKENFEAIDDNNATKDTEKDMEICNDEVKDLKVDDNTNINEEESAIVISQPNLLNDDVSISKDIEEKREATIFKNQEDRENEILATTDDKSVEKVEEEMEICNDAVFNSNIDENIETEVKNVDDEKHTAVVSDSNEKNIEVLKNIEDKDNEDNVRIDEENKDETFYIVENGSTGKETAAKMEICSDAVSSSNIDDDKEIEVGSTDKQYLENNVSNNIHLTSSENVEIKSESSLVNDNVNHISCDEIIKEPDLNNSKNVVETTEIEIKNIDDDVLLCEEESELSSVDNSDIANILEDNKKDQITLKLQENQNKKEHETIEIEDSNVNLISCSANGNAKGASKIVTKEPVQDKETKQNLDQNCELHKENAEEDLILCDELIEKHDIITCKNIDDVFNTQSIKDNDNLTKQQLIEGTKDLNKINETENKNLSDTSDNKFAENEVIDIGDDKQDDSPLILRSPTSEINNSIDIESSPEVADQTINTDNNNSDRDTNEVKNSDIDIHQATGKEINSMESEYQNLVSDTKAKERKKLTLISKLSNTLDILSDEEDDKLDKEITKQSNISDVEKSSINIEDDDVMVIDDETTSKDTETASEGKIIAEEPKDEIIQNDEETEEGMTKELITESTVGEKTESSTTESRPLDSYKESETKEEINQDKKRFLPHKFLTTCKKNLGDMTREELEEFCIIKIVESVVDRSNLGEIKSQLRRMTQHIEEYRKKATMLLKQNRDLQVVLKSVQEEQKKNTGNPVTPLKITRSVGMQVLMTEKGSRKKVQNLSALNPNVIFTSNRQNKQQNNQARKSAQIPVPRLVPAANTNNVKNVIPPTQSPATNTAKPQRTNVPAGVKVASPVMKPEKRTLEKMQQNSSVTVDLTDDEPPQKIVTRNSSPQVRCVPPQNLVAKQPQPQPLQPLNSPRKVYIPIGMSPNQTVRPGQTIMPKNIPQNAIARPRAFGPKVSQNANSIRMGRVAFKHPAPLPDSIKQYQPPNWKPVPPAPDLKLSKVENGIVISWKIDGFVEDNYEEIASYQLFAYQETSSPPSTLLWKKIGDVKALPLPMACTLTQFMAGYKYYFAVRAVDIRSRFGPFSLPGSILLLNKV